MNNLARKVNLREGGLGDIAKPLCETKDPKHWGNDICGRIDPTYSWDRTTDKLAKDMPMPKELKAILRKSFWKASYKTKKVSTMTVPTRTPYITPKAELASTPTDTVAEITAKAQAGQVVSLHHLVMAQQREKQPAPQGADNVVARPLTQQTDPNVDLVRATNVLRSELGVKTSGEVAKLQVVHVAPPRVVKPVDAPKHPRKARPEITGTDLEDGRKMGKWIITLRRRQGKRSSQGVGKQLLNTARRNVGRGQLFYLSMAYGVLESR